MQVLGWFERRSQAFIVLFALVAILLIGVVDWLTGGELSVDSVCILFGDMLCSFLGGLVTALTALGAGEFIALYLLFVYRLRIELAIGTGVAVLAIDSIAGFIFHSHLGGIPWEYLIFTAPGVIFGGFFGARLGIFLEEKVRIRRAKKSYTILTEHSHSPLKYLFAIIILLDGIIMLVF